MMFGVKKKMLGEREREGESSSIVVKVKNSGIGFQI